jgi:acyl-CoA thioesterase I
MIRVLIYGDSLAYGKWDPRGGWAARLRRHIDLEYNIDKGGNHQVHLTGIPGITSRQLVNYVEQDIPLKLNQGDDLLILFQVGVNDANPVNSFNGEQVPIAEYQQNLIKLAEIAKKYTEKVGFISITPIAPERFPARIPHFADKFNSEHIEAYLNAQRETCEANQLDLIDIFGVIPLEDLADGIHPGAEGHKLIERKVIEYIETKLMS